ncbi:AMP-binding protein [Ottowia sp. GY511]|uniref:Class I adenylate-forming enzyme family protein n=1 Tax=Ottowia flava TaxID=2675430 RepID=A0ABW4KQ68_9BURK|nr:AMP-binding protein [Ottowia sp. GY511]TXK33018.1 AMP-binding protein [Ottowia sp. GY511]
MIEMPLTDAARRIRRVALGDLLYRTTQRFGPRTALVDGDQRIDYRTLDARSSQLAHHLLAQVGAGKQVGMLCANSTDMVVATYAIHKAGQVWVPVNIKLDASAIAYILQHAEVSAVVVDEALCAAPELLQVVRDLNVPVLVTMAGGATSAHGTPLAQAEAGQPTDLPDVVIDGDQPALLMYTSGTTGHPKGVVHSHLSVYSAIMGNMVGMRYTEHDVVSGWLPLFHCAQHTLAATACAAGACVVLTRAFVPAEVANLVVREGMTVYVGLPLMYAAVLADPNFRPTTLRQCVYAMAPIPKPLIAQIAERMCPHIMLATGQTEIYPATMTFDPLAHPGSDGNYWGTSLVTNETAVMDDDGRLLGAGQVGEIVHRGPNVMMGYFKDPEATAAAQRFGWHHTGDLGMWDEGGQMVFLDRKKDMIKTGGENVASVRVEAVLLAHPAVAGAAVFGVPHAHWGEAVCAVVVRKPDTDADEDSVLAHCKERLGGFEVPKVVHFVDVLPATATGKVQKHVLRKTLSELLQARAN